MLQMHRLELCWTTERANPRRTVKRQLRNTNSRADYDKRSVRKLGEIIESQQELHCAQAEELQQRDQQRLHYRLLQRNHVKLIM